MKNKNTMAKRCVSFALATVMALSLAGCKAGGNDGSQEAGQRDSPRQDRPRAARPGRKS